MTSLLPDVLERPDTTWDNQRPRQCHISPRVASFGEDACEFYRLAGGEPFEWQRFSVDAVLGVRADGKWAQVHNLLLVSRQNGKGTCLEVIELYLLLCVPGVKLILHSAHELKTAKEHYQRMKTLVEELIDTGELARSDVKYRENNEEISIEVPSVDGKGRTKLRFLARSNGTARGFTADVLVLDEAFALTEAMLGALLPTMSARSKTGNPLVIYASSAGLRTSVALGKLRDRGLAGKLTMLDWSADPDADLDDRTAWAQANPSMGMLITEEAIEAERVMMSDEQFARERLGIWYDPKVVQVIDETHWAATNSEAAIVGEVVFAVAAEVDRSMAAIAVCGLDVDGMAKVEIVESSGGVAWAANALQGLVQRNPEALAVVVDAGSSAGTLLAPLEAAGVEVWTMSAADVKRACAGFVEAVELHDVGHSPDPALLVAIRGADRQQIGTFADAWKWGRKDTVQISPLVAATYAWHGFQTRAAHDKKSKKPYTGKAWF